MKKMFKKINQISQEVKLKDTDRFIIREELEDYIKKNPLSASGTPRSSFGFVSKFLQPKFAGAVVAVVVLLLGTGTVWAAENSLPGDMLYNFKVEVIEEAHSKLTFSKEKKLVWEEERLDRRLQEAEEITSSRTGVKEDTVLDLRDNIEKQADIVLELAQDLEADDVIQEVQKKLSAYIDASENLKDEAGDEVGGKEEENQDLSAPEEDLSDYEVEILDKVPPGLSGHYIELELPNGKIIKIRERDRQGKALFFLEEEQDFVAEKLPWLNILKSKLKSGVEKDELRSVIPNECWESNCRVKFNQKYAEFF